MSRHDFQGNDPASQVCRLLGKQVLQVFGHRPDQDFSAALRAPHEMVVDEGNGRVFVSVGLTHRHEFARIGRVRQAFRFKCFGGKRLKPLHAGIDVAAEIWNHAVALKNRYYQLGLKGFVTLSTGETVESPQPLKAAGRASVKLDRFEPTTQSCQRCGHRQGMPLEVRTFVCEACGHSEDRGESAHVHRHRLGWHEN
jgi:ribosomal protein L37E